MFLESRAPVAGALLSGLLAGVVLAAATFFTVLAAALIA